MLAWTQYPSYRTSASTRPLSPVGLGARTQNPMDPEQNPETESPARISGFSFRVTLNKSPAWDEPQQQNGIGSSTGVG